MDRLIVLFLMKKMIPVFCLLLPALALEEDISIEYKAAELTIPEVIVCKIGTSNYSLSGEVGFRWDGSKPLTVKLWKRKGWGAEPSDKAEHIMGDAEFFDEEGNRVKQWSFVSVPPPPTGEIIMPPGESRQFGFFVWNGYAQFPRPGRYCVTATFYQWLDKTMIVFRTPRRWFRVVEAAPDPEKAKI